MLQIVCLWLFYTLALIRQTNIRHCNREKSLAFLSVMRLRQCRPIHWLTMCKFFFPHPRNCRHKITWFQRKKMKPKQSPRMEGNPAITSPTPMPLKLLIFKFHTSFEKLQRSGFLIADQLTWRAKNRLVKCVTNEKP